MPLQIRNKEHRGKRRTFKVFKWGPNSNQWERRKSRLQQGKERQKRAIEAAQCCSSNQEAPHGLHAPRLATSEIEVWKKCLRVLLSLCSFNHL